MIGKIVHYNFIGREINISLMNKCPQSDREIFCKKLHAIVEPKAKDCCNCSYFGGRMGGYGIECVWEDVFPAHLTAIFVEHKDRYKELERVSKLIAEGYIKKG